MIPLLAWPDAAAAVITAINSELGDVAHGKVPNPRPDELIVVRRVGGTSRSVVVDDASLAIEAWALTNTGAYDLLQQARSVVHSLLGQTVDGVMVYRTREFAGPALLPDPESTSPRYTLTVEVTVKASDISGS